MMAIAWYTLIIIAGLVMSSEALATADLVTAEANSMIYGEMAKLFARDWTCWHRDQLECPDRRC